jgi:hypothetical protein
MRDQAPAAAAGVGGLAADVPAMFLLKTADNLIDCLVGGHRVKIN